MRALALSGGGARGALQAGLLERLIVDQGQDFDVLTGVSVGSLNAAILAQGESLQDQVARLKALWMNIDGPEAIFTPKPAPWYAKALGLGHAYRIKAHRSLHDTAPLRDLLSQAIAPSRVAESPRTLGIGTVNLASARYELIRQDDPKLLDYLLASSAMPGYFPPVWIDGQPYVDGGIRSIVGVRDAIELAKARGASEIDLTVVMATPWSLAEREPRFPDAQAVAERSLAVILNEIHQDDLRTVLDVGDAFSAQSVPIRATVYAPDKDVMGALDFEPAKIRQGHDLGRKLTPVELAQG